MTNKTYTFEYQGIRIPIHTETEFQASKILIELLNSVKTDTYQTEYELWDSAHQRYVGGYSR